MPLRSRQWSHGNVTGIRDVKSGHEDAALLLQVTQHLCRLPACLLLTHIILLNVAHAQAMSCNSPAAQ